MNSDAYKYIRFNSPQETRWSTREEIEQSSSFVDLNNDDYSVAGLPLLSDGAKAYVDNEDTHSLIFGATGSKKTRLFCMPMVNILAKAGESFIVTDPKGEIYAQTSGLVKEKGYKMVVINFRDLGKGDMWNPLAIPYELWCDGFKDDAGLLLSDFVSTFASDQVKNSKDAFWPEAAQSVAIANLYVLMEAAKKEEVNLTSFVKLCSYGIVPKLKELYEMLDEDSVASLNYQSTVCLSANVTVSGIMSALASMLRVFSLNKKLSLMLSENTFDIRMFGREKTAVYIIMPDEKTTYNFLITTFIKQTYEILIAEAQKEKNRQLPIRVNFVLDEFCNIPKIPDMPAMISAARSRNMRFYLVAQSMHQLKRKYQEDAETIKGNCDNWVFLTSKELVLLNEISELCGNIVTSDGKTRRLISVSELQRLDKQKGEALIMHTRQYPIITEMADISSYKMFGTCKPIEILQVDKEEVKAFSINKFLEDIKNLKAIAPFASEKHLISQAKKIWRQEVGFDDDDDEDDFGKFLKNFKSSNTSGKSDHEILKNDLAIKRALERISSLISKEFAERFYNEKLYDLDIDDDDDDDLF